MHAASAVRYSLAMTQKYEATQEQLLEALAIASHDCWFTAEVLAAKAERRRSLVESLLSTSTLPLAELARVAGIHRHTVKAWKDALEEQPEAPRGDTFGKEDRAYIEAPTFVDVPLPIDPADEAIEAD
jgi:hypothetical protein